jgi:hypothetical protein
MVASSSVSASVSRTRPATVTAAVILGVGIQLASIPFFFVPGADEIPPLAIVVGIVMGLLTIVACYGMWNLRRWGAIMTLVVTLLGILSSVPGLFEAPSGWIMAELVVLIPLSVIDMVLIVLPSSWRAF